jgi:hypothetical protein
MAEPGYAKVYHGSATGVELTESWSSYDPSYWGRWAECVAGVGDVNGDGYGDVALGAPEYAGASGNGVVVVYHGAADGLETTPARTYECDQYWVGYGFSVASAGDANGDGYADLLIGSPGYDDDGLAQFFPGSYEGLSQTPTWETTGDQTYCNHGYCVATAGDVNGDGYSDILVGAPRYDHPEENEGLAHCYHGGPYAPRTEAGWVIESNQIDAHFGQSVACVGDVNGDGFGDVLVGASTYDNGEVDEGAAFLFLGSRQGLGWIPAWYAESNRADAYLGVSVASAGDVNGDGYTDAVVGAPGYTNTFADEGAAFVWLSVPGGAPMGHPGNAHWSGFGGEEGADYGRAVSSGDVNGDGFSDVVVGAPFWDGIRTDQGVVCAYFGSPTGLSPTHDWLHASGFSHSRFGLSVSATGDMNGDGFCDVLVGAPRYYVGESLEGWAFVYIGSADGPQTGAPWWNCFSQQTGARLGTSVDWAGDVNGDGYSDVIVGAPRYDNNAYTDGGRVFVWHGAATVPPDGQPTNADWAVGMLQEYGQFGSCVSSAGDVDSDGLSDVIVSTPYADSGMFESNGNAALWVGSEDGVSSSPSWVEYGDQDGCHYGNAVASAGDVNGDGFGDIAVGARYYTQGQTAEGRAFVYYGNDNRGLARTPEQWRSDLSAPIAPLGISDVQTAFALKVRGRTPAGRGSVRMECEVKRHGTPFDGTGTVVGDWADTGAPAGAAGSVVELSEVVNGLSGGPRFRWRVRLVTSDPFFPRTPWFYMPYNGGGEMDFRTGSGGTGVAERAAAPIRALGLRNHPNPFNPSTTLVYDLPAPAHVRLDVYDVQGRLVRTLVDEVQPAGEKTVVWDGRDDRGAALASGAYVASIEAGGHAQSRKLMLIK